MGFLLLTIGVIVGAAIAWLIADVARLRADLRPVSAERSGSSVTRIQPTRSPPHKSLAVLPTAITAGLDHATGDPVVMLDAFVDTVPRDLWITSFEDKGASLKIVGTAYSTRAVSEFMNNLRQSGKFKDVDILISRQDLTKSPIMVTFELTCRFEA